jgi:V8-like Glu-specific endopeptidase
VGRRLAAVLLVLAATMLACPAVAAPPPAGKPADKVVTAAAVDSHTEAERVLGYWTRERMARARPADRLVASAPVDAGGPVPAGGRPTRIAAAARRPARIAAQPVRFEERSRALGGGFAWEGSPEAPVAERTGKVFFTSEGVDYVCSGSAVTSDNKDVVWTAGHCVHAGNPSGGFHTNWVFVPARHDGVNPYGIWTARILATTGRWARDGDLAHDLGAAVTNVGGDDDAHLVEEVGGLAIWFDQPRNQPVYAFGYPAEDPYDGEHLVYCSGTAFDDPDDKHGLTPQGVDCDMGNGASGGPWLAKFNGSLGAVVGVNAYVYPGTARVFAPYQGDAARALYDQVRDA